VRAEPKTIGTADINATTMVLIQWQTQHFIQTASCKAVPLPLPVDKVANNAIFTLLKQGLGILPLSLHIPW